MKKSAIFDTLVKICQLFGELRRMDIPFSAVLTVKSNGTCFKYIFYCCFQEIGSYGVSKYSEFYADFESQ